MSVATLAGRTVQGCCTQSIILIDASKVTLLIFTQMPKQIIIQNNHAQRHQNESN